MNHVDIYLVKDHPARSRVMFVSILVGVSVGVVGQLAGYSFHAAVVASVLATGIVEIFGMLGYREPVHNDQQKLAAFSVRRGMLRAVFASAAVALLSLLRVPEVEARMLERKLHQASVTPTDLQSIHEAQKILAVASNARIKIAPTTVEYAGKRFLEASSTNSDAWVAALSFLDYRSLLNASGNSPLAYLAENVSGTMYFFGSPENATAPQLAHFGHAPISNAAKLNLIGVDFNADRKEGDAYLLVYEGAISIDRMEMKNVVFRDVKVVYSGAPVVMDNIYLVNCTFEMSQTPNSQALSTRLIEGSPITFSVQK
jgi:hypothetical protein